MSPFSRIHNLQELSRNCKVLLSLGGPQQCLERNLNNGVTISGPVKLDPECRHIKGSFSSINVSMLKI